MPILDSGERREFSSGAVRDMSEEKGRCDLLPWEAITESTLLTEVDKEILRCLDREEFRAAADIFVDSTSAFSNIYDALLEYALHMSEGLKKYGPNNWKLGIPIQSFKDSAMRHYLKYRRGDTDESHDRAFIWNCFCAEWTKKNIKEEVV